MRVLETHYFDENGQTVTFVRTSNFLHSVCTKGTAFEEAGFLQSAYCLAAR